MFPIPRRQTDQSGGLGAADSAGSVAGLRAPDQPAQRALLGPCHGRQHRAGSEDADGEEWGGCWGDGLKSDRPHGKTFSLLVYADFPAFIQRIFLQRTW